MKKAISLILSVVMLFSITAGLVFSVNAQTNPSIESVTVNASPGDNVKIPVKIKNNTGLMGFKLIFDYNENAFEPVSVEYGDLLTGGIQDNIEGDSVPGKFCVYWAGYENMSDDGILFYINMKVKEDAYKYSWGYGGESGYRLSISVSFSQEDTFDEEFNDVKISNSRLIINLGDTDTTWYYMPYYAYQYDDNLRRYSEIDSIVAGDTFVVRNGNCQGSHDCDDLLTWTSHIKYNTDIFEFIGWNKDYGVIYEDIPVLDDGDITVSYNANNLTIIDSDFPNVDLLDNENEIYAGSDMVFKVKDKAQSGTYTFDCTATDYNVDYMTVKGFDLTVLPSATSEIAEISISDGITGQNGDLISVPVNIENNHGIMGYRITVKFNPDELEIISAEKSNEFAGIFNDSIGNKTGEFDLLWNNTEEIIKDGYLFTLKFNVITQNDVTSKIQISYSQEDTFNEEYSDVVFNCTDSEIKLCYQHNYILNAVSPTCEDQGYNEYICVGCGNDLKTEYTDAMGHMYEFIDDYNNEMNYICNDCGKHISKPANQIYAMWDIKYVNKPPKRTAVDDSCYLDVANDNVINAKDFAIINKSVKIPIK